MLVFRGAGEKGWGDATGDPRHATEMNKVYQDEQRRRGGGYIRSRRLALYRETPIT